MLTKLGIITTFLARYEPRRATAGGTTRTPEKSDQWDQAHAVKAYNVQMGRYSPAQAWHDCIQVLFKSQWLSPILWPLAIGGIAVVLYRREFHALDRSTWITVVLWMFACWWLLTHRIDRFWLPATPFLALLAGSVWQSLYNRSIRKFLGANVGLGVLFSLLQMSSPIQADDGSYWVLGEWRWLTPLVTLRAEISPAHAKLNEIVEKEAAVLLVGDATPFDLMPQAYYSTCFDDCLLETFTRNRTRAEIAASLQERRIAYILVDWKEIERYRSPGNYGFTYYVQPEEFEHLVRAGVLEATDWREEHEGKVMWEIYRVR